MKIIFRAIVSLCLTVVFSLGQDATRISDPELDFVKNSFQFASATNKKEIIRKEIDITGEGAMAVFLRASVGGGRCGEYWTVYVKINGDTYQRYEDIEFREDTFRAGKVSIFNPKGGILAHYPGKGVGSLMQISFDSGQAITRKLRNIDYSNPEDQLIFESIFERKLGQPMPDEFFNNPPHKVIAVAEILARPQASNSQPEPSKNSVPKPEVSEAAIKSQSSYKTSEKGQVSARIAKTHSASWPLLIALIITAMLLLWLLRNKYICARPK